MADLSRRPEIILGGSAFGTDQAPDAKTVKTWWDLFTSYGHTALDLARLYPAESPGLSEKLTGDAGVSRRAVLITKCMPIGAKAHSAAKIAESIDGSLKDLQVDCVDVMFLHMPTTDVPMEETAEAIDVAYKQGKFERFGLSNFSPTALEEWIALADRKGRSL